MRHRVLLRRRDGARQPDAAQDRRARHLHEPRLVHQSAARHPSGAADGLDERSLSVETGSTSAVHHLVVNRHRRRVDRGAVRQDDRGDAG